LAITVVGYGIEDGKMFWKLKNTWGVSWGEEGYVRMSRTESSISSGTCGLALLPIKAL